MLGHSRGPEYLKQPDNRLLAPLEITTGSSSEEAALSLRVLRWSLLWAGTSLLRVSSAAIVARLIGPS